eukprot:gene9097-1400_t
MAAEFLPFPLDVDLSPGDISTACLYLYDDHERVVLQIQPCLQHWPHIKARIGQYVSQNGEFFYLVYLDGLLPMVYQGHEYSTPIRIWIPKGFPSNCPLPYVVPTATLQIQICDSYDATGQVKGSYLDSWTPGISHLFGLLEWLSARFGEIPPLRAVQQPQPPPNQPWAQQQSYYSTSNTPRQPASSLSEPTSLTASQPNTGVSNARPRHQSTNCTNTSNSGENRPGKLDDNEEEEILRQVEEESMKQYVCDKIRRDLQSFYNRKDLLLQDLREDESALLVGRQQLESFISCLNEDLTRAKEKLADLQKREQEIDRIATSIDAESTVNWDDAIQAETPLERQLLNLISDDNAISDTLEQLSTFFDEGEIELATFLKHVKHLAKEQFKIRSLIKKARTVGKFPQPPSLPSSYTVN